MKYKLLKEGSNDLVDNVVDSNIWKFDLKKA